MKVVVRAWKCQCVCEDVKESMGVSVLKGKRFVSVRKW